MRRLSLFFIAIAAFAQRFPTNVATDADLLVARNSATTTLATTVNASATTIVLTSGATFGNNQAITIGNEHIFCTTLTSNTLSGCARGYDGSSAASHTAGATVSGFLLAKHHNALKDEVEAIETSLGANLANIPGGSVFAGSTATNPAFSSSPTFSLANVTGKSPVRFEPGAMTGNVIATFSNKSAGAKFSIVWTQDGTGGRTVSYDGNTFEACAVASQPGAKTTQWFEVANNGTSVYGAGCKDDQGGQLAEISKIQSGQYLYCSDSSSSGTTLTCTISGLTAYTAGMEVRFVKSSTACTGGTATTLNISSLGVKAIKQADGTTDPASGDCPASRQLILRYDGTLFRILGGGAISSGGGSTNSTPFWVPWGIASNNAGQSLNGGASATLYLFALPSTPGAMALGKVISHPTTAANFAWSLYSQAGAKLATSGVGAGCSDCLQSMALSYTTAANTTYYVGFCADANTSLIAITNSYTNPLNTGTTTLVMAGTAANGCTWSGGVPTTPSTTGAITAATIQMPWLVLTY